MFSIITFIRTGLAQIKKRDYLILVGLLTLFLLTRLVNLDKFPIFTDEGIYIRWSFIAWKDAMWRFISLTDGRQPLQTWATIPFLKLFEENLLLGGRLFAVFFGLVSLVGMIFSAWYMFGRRAGLWTGFLYVITPYFLFHERLALVDSAVNAFTIWMFVLFIILGRKRRLDIALILGLVSGFALLTKSSAKIYLVLGLSSMIFVIFSENKSRFMEFIFEIKKRFFTRKNNEIPAVIDFAFLYGVTAFLAILIYNVQRLSQFFHYVTQKNKTFVLTLPEFVQNPFQYFPHNIVNIPYYLGSEMAYIPLILCIIGLFLARKRYPLITLYALVWILSPLLVVAFMAKVLYPRYIMSVGGFLIPFGGYALSQFTQKKLYAILAVTIGSVAYFNYTILFSPAQIPLPQVDRGQYLEGWPAGWGIKEIVEYARARSLQKPIVLVAEGNFGMSGDVLSAHLKPGDRITISPHWPLNLKELRKEQPKLKDNEVYIVFSHRSEFPTDWPIQMVQEFDKPGDESKIYLYKLLPSKE